MRRHSSSHTYCLIAFTSIQMSFAPRSILLIQALVSSNSSLPSPTPTPQQGKIPKPPNYKPDEPELQEYEGHTWKWCDNFFSGIWN